MKRKALFCAGILLISVFLISACSQNAASTKSATDAVQNEISEYHSGLAVACIDPEEKTWGVVDANGSVYVKFAKKSTSTVEYLNNGNIFFTSVSLNLQDAVYDDYKPYMFCKNSGKMVAMPEPARDYATKIDYSDGLMIIYSDVWRDAGTRYFDGDGNLVLDLDNSNENYAEVTWASGFEDDEAVVFFKGKDHNNYMVCIDKSGNWLTEPEQKKGGRRFGDYDLVYDNPFK